MAVSGVTRIVLFTDKLYRPGGQVFGWVRKITLRFSAEAKKAAPKRSGELARSIRAGTPRNPTRKSVEGTISVSAPHTMFVLRGTANDGTGRIYSSVGYALRASGSPTHTMVPVERRTGKHRGPGLRPKPVPGSRMAVGRRPWPPTTPMVSVQGQKANNFLERAWRATARDHRAIRGMPFPVEF